MSAGNLVTALVPVRNGEQSLVRTVESVLKQSHSNLEVVIVDDGSIDSTASLAKRLAKDSRVSVIDLPLNCGRAVARNAGVAIAQGDFVAICDCGDIFEPDRFENSLSLFAESSAVQMVGGQIRREHNGRWQLDKYFRRTGEDVARAASQGTMRIAHPAAMLRRSAYEAVGNYHPSLRRCEDLYMTMRIADRFGSPGFAVGNMPMTSYDRPTNPSLSYVARNEAYRLLAIELARTVPPTIFPVDANAPPEHLRPNHSVRVAAGWLRSRAARAQPIIESGFRWPRR